MKKVLKTFVLTMIMVLCAGAVCVSASTESKIKKLVGKMKNYELAFFYENDGKIEGTKAVNLNKDKKGRAAALSLEYTKKDIASKADQGIAKVINYKVDSTRFQKATLNLFGKKLKLKNITSVVNNGTFDAYKTRDYGVIVHTFLYDTGLDYVVNSVSIKQKNSKKYIVDKEIYFGPMNEKHKNTNYVVRYAVEPCKKSVFGFKITGMKVTKL